MNRDNEKKIAAIYCRVSTFEQGQGDFSSLKGQEDLLGEYCKNKKWDVADVYIDRASGSSLEREEIKRLLEDAEEGKFNVLLATKLDRVSRSVLDYLDLDKRLTALDIDIVFSTQNIDTTTPAGKMQRNIMLAFAEFERDMIAERTREKLFYQAQQGFWGGGHTILGYDVENKKLVVNQIEAELVRRIFGYYLEERSLGKVAEKLNNAGYRAKERTTKKGEKKGGGLFNKDSINRILRNKIYLGKITYKNEEFKGLHSSIIDEGIFKSVQHALERSRVERVYLQRESNLLLLGLLKCGNCGSSMTTSFTTRDGERYYYYKCVNKSKSGKDKCSARDLPSQEIDRFIESLIIQIASSDPLFNSVFSQLSHNKKEELVRLKRDRDDLNKNKNKISSEIGNLLKFITRENVGDSKSIKKRLDLLEGQYELVDNELIKIHKEIESLEKSEIKKSDLKNIFNEFPVMLKEASLKNVRKWRILLLKKLKYTCLRNHLLGKLIYLSGVTDV